MSSCKKSIENMTILDDKQITEVINKYYSSDDFVNTITNVSKKIEKNGLQILGNIDIIGNVKADGEVSNQNISFTDLNNKIDDKLKNRTVTPSFRNIIFESGGAFVDNIKDLEIYWIYAAHNGNQLLWGFFINKVGGKYQLIFYNYNNKKCTYITIVNNIFVDRNSFTSPYTITISQIQGSQILNIKQKLRVESDVTNINCKINAEDIPTRGVSFFEGWRNSNIPFEKIKNVSENWLSAFDLYKSSTSIPSISFQ